MSDWIKIHRSILNSYAFANPVSLKIWTWMLLKANYKPSYIPLKVGKGTISLKVERGQFVFGRFKAEEELGIDGSTIYRQLKKFEELEQIKIEPNNQYSIITVCNYDFYQSKKDSNEQQTNSQRTADEQQMNSRRTAGEHSIEELEGKEYKEVFNNYPLPENFNGLPEIKVGSSIQLLKITKQVDVSTDDVNGLWEVFKDQNLTGKNHYHNQDAVYSHFINWIKDKKFDVRKNITKAAEIKKMVF